MKTINFIFAVMTFSMLSFVGLSQESEEKTKKTAKVEIQTSVQCAKIALKKILHIQKV